MHRSFPSGRDRSLLLLIIGLVGMLVFLGRSAYIIVDGLLSLAREGITLASLGPSLLDALGTLFCACLLLPLSLGSLRHLRGRPLKVLVLPPVRASHLLILLAAWLSLLSISSLLTALFDLGWFFSSPAFILAMALPPAFFAWVASGGIYTGSRRRLWAAIGLGMTGGTGLALVLEYALVLVVLAIAAVVVAIRPEFLQVIQDLISQVQSAPDMEQLVTVLAPYLVNPWIFLLILGFAALAAPLIEEAVKPLAVWLLGRRLRSPAEGFAVGALSGAGFALLEGLLAASSMAETPWFGLPARLASSLMHVTLSAVVGWGIASAMLKKRWLHLAAAYALSVILHGLWNGSALLAVYGSLRFMDGELTPDIIGVLVMGVGVLTIGSVFLLILFALPLANRRLRPRQDDIIPPLASPLERTPDGLDTQAG